MEMNFRHGDNMHTIHVEKKDDIYHVRVDDKEYHVRASELKPGLIQLESDTGVNKFVVSVNKDERHVFQKGGVFKLERITAGGKAVVEEGQGDLNSPITGKVVSVKTAEGDVIEEGEVIMILEAMKMEYQIKAPYAGKITKMHFEEGAQVEMGALLVDLEEEERGE